MEVIRAEKNQSLFNKALREKPKNHRRKRKNLFRNLRGFKVRRAVIRLGLFLGPELLLD